MSESIGYNLRKFARKFTEFPLVEIKDKIINHKSINKIPPAEDLIFLQILFRYLTIKGENSIKF